MNGKIVVEVELFPEIQGLGPRRGIRFEMHGPVRGAAEAQRQTPSTAGEMIRSPTIFNGVPVVVINAAAETGRNFGWLKSDENLDEMILSATSSTVDLRGRSDVNNGEQTSEVNIGHPIAWNWAGVLALYLSSARFSEDHPYSLWWNGVDATAVCVTVIEFEEGQYVVDEEEI